MTSCLTDARTKMISRIELRIGKIDMNKCSKMNRKRLSFNGNRSEQIIKGVLRRV